MTMDKVTFRIPRDERERFEALADAHPRIRNASQAYREAVYKHTDKIERELKATGIEIDGIRQ